MSDTTHTTGTQGDAAALRDRLERLGERGGDRFGTREARRLFVSAASALRASEERERQMGERIGRMEAELRADIAALESMTADMDAARERITGLIAVATERGERIATLEGALRPFAEFAAHGWAGTVWEHVVDRENWGPLVNNEARVTLADFDRAVSVMRGDASGGTQGERDATGRTDADHWREWAEMYPGHDDDDVVHPAVRVGLMRRTAVALALVNDQCSRDLTKAPALSGTTQGTQGERDGEATQAEKKENALRMHRHVATYLKAHYPEAYDAALYDFAQDEVANLPLAGEVPHG